MNLSDIKNNSNFRYIKRTTKDLFSIMPLEISIILFVKILSGVVAFIQVYISAAFFDTAGRLCEGSATAFELFEKGAIFIAFIAIAFVFELIQLPINDIRIPQKNQILKEELLKKTASSPLIKFEDAEFYNKLSRAKTCIVSNGLLKYFYGFTDFFSVAFRFAGIIAVISSFHSAFIPIAVVSIIPSFISKWFYNKALFKMRRHQTPLARKRDYLWGVLTGVNTVKELRVFGSDTYFKKIWTDTRDECLEQDFKMDMKSTNVFMLCDIIKLIGFACSVAFAVYLVGNRSISIGQFSACIAAFGSLQTSTENVVGMIADQNKKADYAGDYYDFIDEIEKDFCNESNTYINNSKIDIAINNLSFSYPTNTSFVLKNVNFSIKSGEHIVIVGENGSGKTTLSKLLVGVFTPTSGQILINGIDSNTISRKSLYNMSSIVQQDFIGYKLSLRENIGLGSPNDMMNDLYLLDSAKRAGVLNIIERIGLDTSLGREFDGMELSGGEWQKIAIARCLNKKSDIVILDEPTSALDPLMENEILNKFIEMTTGKTAVIISHRVGICIHADKIIVLKSGEVVEMGKHTDLLKTNGEYARLWNEQAKWYVN